MNNIDRIQKKLSANDLCFGTHCSTTDLDFYEMCGPLGYDYVWIDNEHAGMTQPMIKNAIIATNAGGSCAFVRVPDHQMAHIKPVLEVGPDGIIFPMVNSAQQARDIVSICTYPPKGIRGFGPLRAVDYNLMDFQEYLDTVNDRTMLLMQCETVDAVNNLDEILDVEGVDAIICGPMDLSASAGKIGQFKDSVMVELFETIIAKCKAHGKPYGLSIGMDRDLIRVWAERGASFLSMGTPQDYFRELSADMIREARAVKARQ